MATAALPGYQGEIFLGGNKVGEVKEVTLTVERDAMDATSHDSGGWEESIAGIARWTFSASALYLTANTAQTAAFDALVNGTNLTFKFQPKAQAGLPKFEGTAQITNWELASPTSDAAAVSIQGKGTGPLAKAAQ